jgi:hypothetical protein
MLETDASKAKRLNERKKKGQKRVVKTSQNLLNPPETNAELPPLDQIEPFLNPKGPEDSPSRSSR